MLSERERSTLPALPPEGGLLLRVFEKSQLSLK